MWEVMLRCNYAVITNQPSVKLRAVGVSGRLSFEMLNAPKTCSFDMINALELFQAALLSAYKAFGVFCSGRKEGYRDLHENGWSQSEGQVQFKDRCCCYGSVTQGIF